MRAKQPIQASFVDRGDVELFYEVFGEGSQTMLFVPTWSLVDSRVYKAQIPYFSDRYRVITYDPRGNGKSGRPDQLESYTIDRYADDVIAVMDATGTEKAILFGFSFSGLVCSIVAANHPERVRAMITVGANCPLVPNYEYRSPARYKASFDSHDGWNKHNREYWQTNFADFAQFFLGEVHNEPHSTKQLEDAIEWAAQTTGEVITKTIDSRPISKVAIDEAMYRRIQCPCLIIHGDNDMVVPLAASAKLAELTDSKLEIIEGAGHAPHARYPARINLMVRDFLAAEFGPLPGARPPGTSTDRGAPRVLYLSSPIGLGHGRRDLAVADALRELRPGLQIEWLAQDPVTRLLRDRSEFIHPASGRLASESRHIEQEAGEHDLNAFQALRRMDEILVANFMVFQEVVENGNYDLVVADEAWDVDHFWHEHPELKKTQIAWLTDFVGFVPMPAGGAREAALTTDYNAEMIGHVERHRGLRDRAIFVGQARDVVDLNFGQDLPSMRPWVDAHFDYCGYILGQHPKAFGSRLALRERLGFRPDEKVCIVTVGGSGVGTHLIRRILAAYPMAKSLIPELRLRIVTGPRLDPASLATPAGVEALAFVPQLDEQLAACDLAMVQGGLSTCMELTAAGTPFIYFPLRNHFEQQIHVAHRLDNYRAGLRMDFDEASPERITSELVALLRKGSNFDPVEADGAGRAAVMLAELL